MNKIIKLSATACAAVALFVFISCGSKKLSQETIDAVETSISSAQQYLPIDAENSYLTAIDFDENKGEIVYRYEMKPDITTGDPKQDKKNFKEGMDTIKEVMVSATKYDHEMTKLLNDGVVFTYSYYAANGDHLGDISITDKDIR